MTYSSNQLEIVFLSEDAALAAVVQALPDNPYGTRAFPRSHHLKRRGCAPCVPLLPGGDRAARDGCRVGQEADSGKQQTTNSPQGREVRLEEAHNPISPIHSTGSLPLHLRALDSGLTISFRHHGSHLRTLPPVPMEVEGGRFVGCSVGIEDKPAGGRAPGLTERLPSTCNCSVRP